MRWKEPSPHDLEVGSHKQEVPQFEVFAGIDAVLMFNSSFYHQSLA